MHIPPFQAPMVCKDGCVRTYTASTDTAQGRRKENACWCDVSFLGASSGNTLSGQDLWCPCRGFGWCPWGPHQMLQGLLLDLFQVLFTSAFTSFAGKPVPHHHHSTAAFVCVCIYINVCTYAYIHMYTNLFQAIICLQPNAHTTAVQKSRQLQTSFFPTVSVRLGSKSLLVLMWDKGALSLFSWRVAMATWHKDISIAV